VSKLLLTAVDLCCGAGGWACAARGLPIKIKMAVDLWTPACRTYSLNHPDTEVIEGDLRDEDVQGYLARKFRAGVDLVLGGIPCEWLSVYRSLQKVSDAERDGQRDTLRSVLAITQSLNPEWWCLEDVEQLIPELPAGTPYAKLDASGWCAQRRKRVFVGKFPVPDNPNSALVLKDRLRQGPFRIGNRLIGRTPQRSRTFTNTTTLAAELDRKAPTVLSQSSRRDANVAVVDPSLPGGMRNFEWQEYADLQGFPRDYLFVGSPSDVSKQVGRAIQIDLGRAILGGIVDEARKIGRLGVAR